MTTLQRVNVETLPRVNAVPDHVVDEPPGPAGYKRRVRYEKPHASIYAHPKVFKALGRSRRPPTASRMISTSRDCGWCCASTGGTSTH